jgi:hypothetical protein
MADAEFRKLDSPVDCLLDALDDARDAPTSLVVLAGATFGEFHGGGFWWEMRWVTTVGNTRAAERMAEEKDPEEVWLTRKLQIRRAWESRYSWEISGTVDDEEPGE